MEKPSVTPNPAPTLEERIQTAEKYSRFWRFRVLEEHAASHLDACSGPCHLEGPGILDLLSLELDRMEEEGLLELLAYCLLPNHLHLLVRPGKETGKPLPPEDARDPGGLAGRLLEFQERTETPVLRRLGLKAPLWSPQPRSKKVSSTRQFRFLLHRILENPARSGRDALLYNAMSGLPPMLDSVAKKQGRDKALSQVLTGDDERRETRDGEGRPVFQPDDGTRFFTLYLEEAMPARLLEDWNRILKDS